MDDKTTAILRELQRLRAIADKLKRQSDALIKQSISLEEKIADIEQPSKRGKK